MNLWNKKMKVCVCVIIAALMVGCTSCGSTEKNGEQGTVAEQKTTEEQEEVTRTLLELGQSGIGENELEVTLMDFDFYGESETIPLLNKKVQHEKENTYICAVTYSLKNTGKSRANSYETGGIIEYGDGYVFEPDHNWDGTYIIYSEDEKSSMFINVHLDPLTDAEILLMVFEVSKEIAESDEPIIWTNHEVSYKIR